ncbi:hypothetical protein [Alteromonas sp. CYL-A6]|uniref:hypothetical protein n=1 Tax=Alteromonas nitratireducens TaxID=3390813 RepID=UPI0034BFC9ED
MVIYFTGAFYHSQSESHPAGSPKRSKYDLLQVTRKAADSACMNVVDVQLPAGSDKPTQLNAVQQALGRAVASSGQTPVSIIPEQGQWRIASATGTNWIVAKNQAVTLTPSQPYSMTRLPGSTEGEAVLLTTRNQRVSGRLNDVQQAQLTQQLMKLVASSDTQFAFTTQARVTQVSSTQLTIALTAGQLTLPRGLLSVAAGSTLTLSLTSDGAQGIQVSVSGNGPNAPVKLSQQASSQVIRHLLETNGVTIRSENGQRLSALLAPIPEARELAGQGSQLAHLRLSGDRLTALVASQQAIARVNGPLQGVPASDALTLTRSEVQRLPVLSVMPMSRGAVSGGEAVLSPTQAQDVQQKIVQLSRQLLAQTGSPREALNALVQQLSQFQSLPAQALSPALSQAISQLTRAETTFLAEAGKLPAFRRESAVAPSLEGRHLRVEDAPSTATAKKPGAAGAGLGALAEKLRALTGLAGEGKHAQVTPQDTGVTEAKPSVRMTSPAAEQIRALLSAAPLPLSVSALTRPATGNDFLSALVTLLQFSLAGRAVARQPALSARADSSDSPLNRPAAGQTPAASPSRSAQELAQADSRNTLLNALKTLLASHQQARLGQAENKLQGQDTLFYQVPFVGSDERPAELVIQRDGQGNKPSVTQPGQSRCWNLTMRLDTGDSGPLLAKSRIEGDVIEIDIYASSERLLTKVADTLPFLLRRLEASGLTVSRHSLQRGQVPDTLNTQRHHLFETMV